MAFIKCSGGGGEIKFKQLGSVSMPNSTATKTISITDDSLSNWDYFIMTVGSQFDNNSFPQSGSINGIKTLSTMDYFKTNGISHVIGSASWSSGNIRFTGTYISDTSFSVKMSRAASGVVLYFYGMKA